MLSELGVAPGQAAADGPLRESSLALPLTMLPDETDPDVLYSITIGLGTSRDERILDTFLKRSAHQDAQVRWWATFGLTRLTDEDSPRLRAALADRLHDDHLNTRVEAVYGLIARGDPRGMQHPGITAGASRPRAGYRAAVHSRDHRGGPACACICWPGGTVTWTDQSTSGPTTSHPRWRSTASHSRAKYSPGRTPTARWSATMNAFGVLRPARGLPNSPTLT